MSTPVAETKPAEEQVPKEEVKEETSTATSEEAKEETSTTTSEEVQMKEADKEAAADTPTTAEPTTATAMEVDSSQTETKPEAATSGEEAKAEPEAKAEGATADAKAKSDKLRLNASARKRFRWLLDQGYSREEAAQLAKEPLKTKELRDRYNADTNGGGDVDKTEAELKNLGGAAKKRFKWLLKNGYNEKEALKLAREPMNAIASKRILNVSTGDGPASKVLKPTPETAGGIVMAVAARDYPSTNLTNKQTDEVKAAILKEVVQQKDSELKPRFESCVHVKGYLRVHCSDPETRQWLQRVVSKLTVPEGIKLKLAGENNLVKGDVYSGYFTDSRDDTNEAILEFVESQNDGIVTSKWKILTRKEVPNKQTVELMFTVDPVSSKSIHTLGYELNYKFNKVKVRKHVKPADKAAPASAGANRNLRTPRSMNPPQRDRRTFDQPRTNSAGSFVPIWDSNVSPRRVGSSFNQFDSQRSSFSSGSGINWGNARNSFGLGGTGGSDSFSDNNSYGGNNSGGGGGGRSNSFMSSNSRSNSYGGGSNSRSNSYGGSNSRSNSNSNSFEMGGGGRRGGNLSNGNRSFNLVDSLYDQLKLIGSGGGNNSNNSNGYGGSSRRSGGGGNVGGGSNQRGRNTSNNSSFSGRSSSGYGNRNFFTTTRSGFF